jgi:hypothetical protein
MLRPTSPVVLFTVLLASLATAGCGGGSSSGRPLADAGPDQAVPSGALVVLDGSGSTSASGAALTYAWTQTLGPAVALSDPGARQPTFRAPVVPPGAGAVTLSFSLTVLDSATASTPSTVTVTVSAAAAGKPVADAGPGQAVASAAMVSLDGGGSSDPAGRALSYAWTQVSGPAISLSGGTTAHPTFTAPTVASGAPPVALVFSLVVTAGIDSSVPSQVVVTVNPQGAGFPPPPGIPGPAPSDPNPPPIGGSGSKRWQMGAADGLYVQDPAAGEPTVAGFLVVTAGPVSSGNFIPPADTVVTLNGVPLLRDPALNGAYFRVDPAGPQPVVGSGGRIVLVATGTIGGKPVTRTLVLPCPAAVAVTISPPVGASLGGVASVHLASASDLTVNVGVPLMASKFPTATLFGYDPATRMLSGSGSPRLIPPGPLSLDVPVTTTTSGAYLLDLRWPGQFVLDGESGSFCGLAERWTFAR